MCVLLDESFHDLLDIDSGEVRICLPAAYKHDWSSRCVDHRNGSANLQACASRDGASA